MAELQALVRKRGSIKSKLTVFKNFVCSTRESIVDAPLDDMLKIELEQRLVRARSLIDDFDEIQIQIDSLSDDIEYHDNERESFEKEYFRVISQATQMTNVSANEPNIGSLPIDSVPQTHYLHNPGIKLPTIKLPLFDGTHEEWLQYRDTFESLIHKNVAINDIPKFHYLRASLSGSAAQVIKSLEFSATNYLVAWNSLCNRYNNTRLLVHNHIKSIVKIEPIGRESSTQIRKIIDDITKHLRSLNVLGQPTEQWDSIIIYLTADKLDNITIREWETQKLENEMHHLTNQAR